MPEQFAFQELRRNGGAVDGDKGLCLAVAVFVQGTGDKLLARSSLAQNQNGRVAVGCQTDGFLDVADRFA